MCNSSNVCRLVDFDKKFQQMCEKFGKSCAKCGLMCEA